MRFREVRIEETVRRAVVDVLRNQNKNFGGDEVTLRNLDRLRDGAVAVVTGQQVGLFGGPAYSVYKALTAVHVAHELTGRGVNAVPIFWLATEDHDLAEVNHCSCPSAAASSASSWPRRVLPTGGWAKSGWATKCAGFRRKWTRFSRAPLPRKLADG